MIGKRLHVKRVGARRAMWGVADQAISSVGNFFIGFVVARQSSAAEFGAFALTMMVYVLAQALVRASVGEPLAIRFSDDIEPGGRGKNAAPAALGAGLAWGAAIGAVVMGIAFISGDDFRPLFLALALFLPGLMLQDILRYLFVVVREPFKATANDGIWLLLQVSGTLGLIVRETESPVAYIIVWGLAGNVAAATGLWQSGVVPRMASSLKWWRYQRDVGGRLIVEYGVLIGGRQIAMLLLGVLAGLDGIAAVRGMVLLLGPLTTLDLALSFALVPEGVRLRKRGNSDLIKVCGAAGAALFVLTILWGFGLANLSDASGRSLIGETWRYSSAVMVPMTAVVALNGLAAGAVIGLRVLGRVRESMRVRLVSVPVTLVCSGIGAGVNGAVGFAWGQAAATCLSAGVLWHVLRGADVKARLSSDSKVVSDGDPAGPTVMLEQSKDTV